MLLCHELLKEYDRYGRIFEGKMDPADTYAAMFYDRLRYLREEKLPYEKMVFTIGDLIRMVKSFYGIAPVLLIDEYDQPILSSYQYHYRDTLGEFFANFYGMALKGNINSGQALLTGIQRVAKESIFSKLNNIQVYTVADDVYSEYFGLTEGETRRLLSDYGLELNQDVKNQYDGYRFGRFEIYNPWSILNYAKRKILKNYWINTSANYLIQEALDSCSPFFMNNFDTLLAQGAAEVGVTLETSFIELQDDYSLWGLLVNSGYLTIQDPGDYFIMKLRIPNTEVASELQKIVAAHAHISDQDLTMMFKYLKNQDMEQFRKLYSQIVLSCTSYYDAAENDYHMLFLGMCISLRGMYEVTSNLEAGLGRSDITLKALRKGDINMIIEFKQGKDLVQLKEKALSQILQNKYAAALNGPVLCIGLAHDKKSCDMAWQML